MGIVGRASRPGSATPNGGGGLVTEDYGAANQGVVPEPADGTPVAAHAA